MAWYENTSRPFGFTATRIRSALDALVSFQQRKPGRGG